MGVSDPVSFSRVYYLCSIGYRLNSTGEILILVMRVHNKANNIVFLMPLGSTDNSIFKKQYYWPHRALTSL